MFTITFKSTVVYIQYELLQFFSWKDPGLGVYRLAGAWTRSHKLVLLYSVHLQACPPQRETVWIQQSTGPPRHLCGRVWVSNVSKCQLLKWTAEDEGYRGLDRKQEKRRFRWKFGKRRSRELLSCELLEKAEQSLPIYPVLRLSKPKSQVQFTPLPLSPAKQGKTKQGRYSSILPLDIAYATKVYTSTYDEITITCRRVLQEQCCSFVEISQKCSVLSKCI